MYCHRLRSSIEPVTSGNTMLCRQNFADCTQTASRSRLVTSLAVSVACGLPAAGGMQSLRPVPELSSCSGDTQTRGNTHSY